eukprot:COSAG01_NODE_60866_length_292_cov_1.031088_1_plen_24_part_10
MTLGEASSFAGGRTTVQLVATTDT